MSSDIGLEKSVAALTEALLTKDYRQESPLTHRVDLAVKKLADEIANEIVSRNPALRAAIERKTHEAVSAALADDVQLNAYVVQAVSIALSKRVLNEEDEP